MAIPFYLRGISKNRMMLLFIAFLGCYILNFESEVDAFAVKFCDNDGTCHEKPNKPSPRTVYSTWTKEQYYKWWSFNAHLNQVCVDYTKKRRNNREKQSLVMLGDSITESWIGTGVGEPKNRAQGVPTVLNEKFKDYDPVVLAISGDQTQHLLYRIQNGQLPSVDEESAIYVVMIGTNNLGSGELPEPTSKGVLAVADYVLSYTKGRLLLFQILPRGDNHVLKNLCPPRCSSSRKPFESFMPAVHKLNKLVNDGVEVLKEKYGKDRLGLIDCGSNFIANGDVYIEVDETVMPDLLHPNAAGHVFLADCILDFLYS